MIKKSLSLLALTSALSSQAISAEPCHHFEVGAGIGGVYGNFNIKNQEPAGGGFFNYRNYDVAKHSLAGDLSLGYQYLYNNLMLGVEVDYLFSDLDRKINPNNDQANVSHPLKLESKGAFGAVAKVGYVYDKKFIVSVGAGIENRKFKINYVNDNPNSIYNINQNNTQTAFATRLELEYKVKHNVGIGLQWRKAFYQKKKFTKNGASLNFNPRDVDTVLFTVKYKFNKLSF